MTNDNKGKDFKDCKIAVIRVRGTTGVKHDTVETLKRLKLNKKNYCAIYPDTPEIRGMLKKSKDFITYGDLDEETKKLLIEKRAEKDSEGNYFKYFRLAPPRGGFERKGIKIGYNIGGALGDRKENINNLIKKML